ncbi:di-heme oxidoredictase family protein [Thalassomonas actiniarum]|uniref:glucan endo-1,3-beta-D-glucosidase n=1 Tax=Thalassomonas actiniarum TaxID=485447 RepID=A0AAE9YKE9_9GAMM|nr:di-heme oxidoredictase family protein [Thalassomonas actiniarum]WDD97047.1 thrombospondin type 3 repeat-containing protein [Thalassomonas actiniarum]
MRLIRPGWPVTLLTLTTLIAPAQGADWPTEQIGAGAVSLEAVGEQIFDWQGPFARSSRTTPENPYLTANFTGPVPTNDWASSLIMDPFSKSLYAHPLSFKATNEGLEISLPPLSIGSVDNMGETSVRRMHDGNVDLVVKPSTFAPNDARADKITDWSYDLVMANGDKAMKATIGHGLPYAFFEFTGSEPVVSLKRGTSMNIVSNNGHQLHIRIWDPVANHYNHYGLFAPTGTSWSISATQISADLPEGKNYFTVAGLPDGTNTTFLAFADKAYNFVTDTRVSWSVSDSSGQVSTQYQVTTTAKSEGNNSGTLMALYPHQWRNLSGNTTGSQYESIRGIMKLVAGNSFTTVMDYHGILPRMPDLPDAAAVAEITGHLSDYYGYGASLTPKFIQPGADGGNTGYDTYWMGKNLNRLSGLIGIADMLDDSDSGVAPMTTDMLSSLKDQLEYWFDGNKPTPDSYFYYNQDYGTLIGYPASYGSDNDLNDHHFHYGYWINAAAQIALRDPDWAQDENWGGMVKELINDIAGYDRGSNRYPFLRNFDIYEGHSWASGTVPHDPDGVWAGGNNNEASSEGINAWAGLILWGEATGDKAIRDLGIYLYTHEVETANSYWFNLYGDIGHKDYPNVEASRVWGGGYDHSTWWTEDPVQTHAINFLPITAASMYLGENPGFVQRNFDAIWSEYELWDGNGGQEDKELMRDRWQDLISEYLAFADPDAALARWKSTNIEDDPVNGIDPALGIEFGESRAHTYHHIKSLQLLGQPDFSIRPVGHSLGLVFNKNGVKTYVAYNAGNTAKTLLFSDGKGLVVPANSMAQGAGIAIADSDNDGVADPIDLCPNTPPGTQVDASGCPATVTDSDNDGVIDSLDLCPDTPPGTQVDASGCPVTVPDSDNDGVADNLDQCPDTPPGTQVDANGCPVTLSDSDNDGVADNLDQCPDTPPGTQVDANGCPVTVPDSDNDGVADNLDLCPGTPPGTQVDGNGCPLVVQEFGITQNATTSVTFYVNTNDWAIVHYQVNGAGQLNVQMTDNGSRNEYTVTGLAPGDSIDYWFTYNTPTGAIDTPPQPSYTVTGNTTPNDSDGDGVPDSSDLCPGTPAGTQVDNSGCPAIEPEPTPDDDFGITQPSTSSVSFYVNTSDWAIVHYKVNNGAQQNVTMVAAGSQKTYTVAGLNPGDSIDYWFTYNTPTGAIDTPPQPTYQVSSAPDGPDTPDPDSDGDGIPDSRDLCADTPSGTQVDNNGCPVSTPVNREVASASGLLVGGADSSFPGFTLYRFDNDSAGQSNCFDTCAQSWPPLLVTDGVPSGIPQQSDLSTIDRGNGTFQVAYLGKPLYFYSGDTAAGQTRGQGLSGLWWTVAYGQPLGEIVPLYDENTPLADAITFDRGDALITRFSDRARDRHAKENHFQAYDHFLSFYWEDRTAAIEIIDYVAKGGSSIRMNVKTLNKLDDLQAENRWWYMGNNTLAEYCGNGVMATTDNRNYVKEDSWNCRENRPIQIGDKLEFEISQFLDASALARGRSNYYGTTYLYIVGEGLMPWDVTDKEAFVGGKTFQRDSIPVPESARAGGDTSLHVQMTAEPDGHFQQMATNLAYDNGQPWVLGRRVHHSSFVDGSHDENAENGIFEDVAGLTERHYINERCSSCHVRNGRAVPAGPGETLEKWVFKVGDVNGNPHPALGRVLQGRASNAAGEGLPSIASWTETDGLRAPNYQFSGVTPDKFSARITPQLNGLGLLEAIPETSILALADENDSNGDGISGKAAKVLDPVTGETRLGRFGYKAGNASVKHQVAMALNADMGVMTSVLPTPDCGSEQNDCARSNRQLADEHLENLVKYISLLGVRSQRDYNDAQVLRGKQLFNDISCNSCHVERFETSEFHPLAELRSQSVYPYTDMLLHDMGPGLADNLGEGQATGAEWRTAPLWGIGLSACVTGGVTGAPGGVAFGLDGNESCTPAHGYLHDGRARTLDEAIRWHGGEAQNAALAYQNLHADDKAALLKFIGSL